MSAAQGTEALQDPGHEAPHGSVPVSSVPAERLAVRHARPAPPAPLRPEARQAARPVPARSGAPAWAAALRVDALPAVLLGPALVALVLTAEPGAGALPGLLAGAALVVAHLVAALLRALGDADRRRAGPLHRVEAGRALLGLLVLGLVLTGSLVALRGWTALLVAGAAGAAVVAAVRLAHRDLAVPATALGALATWWAATGALPWRVAVLAAVAAVLVAAVRTPGSARLLVAAPCVAVGIAVAVHALPWPTLLVAAALPVARRTAVHGAPAAAPARLAVVLLLAGLVAAAVTGADLPLTAAR